MFESKLGFAGSVKIKKISPRCPGLLWKLRNFPNLWPGIWREGVARMLGTPFMSGKLYIKHIKADGEIVNLGLVSTRVITTVFVNYLVDQLQSEDSTIGDFLYHDCGEGTTPAAVGDTAMESQYGGSRATGSQEEGSSANIYKSIGTFSFTGSLAITEHGLFNAASSGTLLDRHVFAAYNVVNGDSLQITYELTVSAGG